MSVFTADEFQSLKDAFKESEKDRNGLLATRELRAFIKKLDSTITDQQINTLIDKYDTGRDGCLNFSEFKAGMEDLGDMED
ncbi:hypothetical protein BGX31_010174 [Mortierella sp. GBA43]|nr:hypothetical protein BGX31_010174 [Mortierella sp. GBA43]